MDISGELIRLIQMHGYKRPAGSRHERKFINRYIRPTGARCDAHGNWIKVIGDSPRHIWSSHTDTVHRFSGKQRVYLDAHGVLTSTSGECLGADDTAGVWMMLELIRRGVAGRYVFHYGEERGCIGSRNLIRECPEWLQGIDSVIALDRMHTDDVITHQNGARTASEKFSRAIADQLNTFDPRFTYAPSEWGMYTDSESYADTIAECTNLSVGYTGQHGKAESLDTVHALRLLEALTHFDPSALPIIREPGEDDPQTFTSTYSGSHDDTFWDRPWDRDFNSADAYRASTSYRRIYFCENCGLEVEKDCDVCDDCGLIDPTHRNENSYLDRVYADVQDALREDMRRRANNRKDV